MKYMRPNNKRQVTDARNERVNVCNCLKYSEIDIHIVQRPVLLFLVA